MSPSFPLKLQLLLPYTSTCDSNIKVKSHGARVGVCVCVCVEELGGGGVT